MRKQLFFLFLLLSISSQAQQMRIGVLRDYAIKKILFSHNVGSYTFYGDSLLLGTINANEFIDLSLGEQSTINLKKGATDLGTYKKIVIIQNSLNTSITLNTKVPNIKLRKYKDDFEITATDRDLKVVNLVDMNNYLAGVVESEGGGKKELEYYKVQAIMSRTYALKYRSKHAHEGFEMCDRVHCQAYHSMNRFTPIIDSAVLQTHGAIMEDEFGNYVDAYFHANCGGQTCLPEHVWNKPVPYLSTFKDTFCIYTKQATWEKRIDKQEWRRFLVDNYNYPEKDSLFGFLMYNFVQNDRLAFFVSPVLGIPLRDLRYRFHLKSTYFTCHLEGDEVVLEGRGFGHGVGLCQEGAMKMAVYGFSYEQIIKFYFPGVEFRNLVEDAFFAQKETDISNF